MVSDVHIHMCFSEARSPGSRVRFAVFVSGLMTHVHTRALRMHALLGLGRMSSHTHVR